MFIRNRTTVLLWLTGASLACSAAAQPAGLDLTGRWLHEEVSANGKRSQIVMVLQQDHQKLSGRVMLSWEYIQLEIPIKTGDVRGNTFHFEAMTPADLEQPATYDGAWNGKLLEVHSRWPDDKKKDYTASRTSDTTGDPPALVPLPAIRELRPNGLAATPPMGWNSWNHFQEKIDDKAVREIADAIVATGMREAGYIYINIDDTWEGNRDAQGVIHSNRKFPDMKALSDYVHSKGLKIGIYSSPGPKTCGGYEGSFGHEEQDARTYAEWGIDYLKYDWCSAGHVYSNKDLRAVYQKMGEALRKSGRPIVYSLCQYGMGDVWTWGPATGANLWRTGGDIGDSWKSMEQIGFSQGRLAPYAATGHWNDPDMLEVGNGGMSNIEYRTHMTLWGMLAAPLLAGNDLRNMTPEIRNILTNREVIAIDQDRLGHQGARVFATGATEVWTRPLEDRSMAIALFNRGDGVQNVSFKWSQLGMKAPSFLRDLWSHTDPPVNADGFDVEIPSHGSVMLRAVWSN